MQRRGNVYGQPGGYGGDRGYNDHAMSETNRELRGAQQTLSTGNSILGTVGSISRNLERLGGGR